MSKINVETARKRILSLCTMSSMEDALAGKLGEYKRGYYTAVQSMLNSLKQYEHGYISDMYEARPDLGLPNGYRWCQCSGCSLTEAYVQYARRTAMSATRKTQTAKNKVESLPERSSGGLHFACDATDIDGCGCNNYARHIVNKRQLCRVHLIAYCWDRGIELPFKPAKLKKQ